MTVSLVGVQPLYPRHRKVKQCLLESSATERQADLGRWFRLGQEG